MRAAGSPHVDIVQFQSPKAVPCVLELDILSSAYSTGYIQEDKKLSQHDLNIVGWGIKPQPKQKSDVARNIRSLKILN